MIKNRKYLIVLSIITLLCLCLCLSVCGKNNKTSDVKDNTTISQNQTDDKTKDSKSGNNTAKDSGQKQDQPKVIHQKDGSGVETIDSKADEQNPSGSAQSPSSTYTPIAESGKTTEVKPEQGVEPIDESKNPGKKSESCNPASPTMSSAAKEYADYCAMSSEKQYAYYKSFKSADAFMNWYNAAKAAYEKENPAVELNPGDVIDLGN